MKAALVCLLFAGSGLAYGESTHPCTSEASKQAVKLLAFHRGPDDRTMIESVETIRPIRNPQNKKQTFDVLEVWASIYKGKYRMRFIYARLEGCTLMGQEILEYANL